MGNANTAVCYSVGPSSLLVMEQVAALHSGLSKQVFL